MTRSHLFACNLFAALSLVACGRAHDEGGRYQLFVGDLSPGTEIVVAGTPVGTLNGSREIDVVLPKGVFVADGKGSIAANIKSPCGPKSIVLAPGSFSDLATEKRSRSMKHASYTSLEVPPTLKLQRIWIDRTRAPEVAITVGALELGTQMEVHGAIDLVWPDCEEGRIIRAGGKEIGRLPAQPPKDQELVLATAPGCYRLREVRYTSSTLLTFDRGPDGQRFERTQLAWVTPLMHFLEAAPLSITSEQADTRNELLAIACARERIGRRAR